MQRLIHHDGKELIVAFLGRSEVAGLQEMVLRSPSEMETFAGNDSTMISIPWRTMAEIPAFSCDFFPRVSDKVARDYFCLLDKLAKLSFCSLEGRIASFLLDLQPILGRTPLLRLNQGMIARAVGASRPKVNRCLKTLEGDGVIAWRKGAGPDIRDPAALTRLV